MMELLFTIFTPTYNRAYILPRLFDSLKEQTIKNFEWLIVDDGSTDSTDEMVMKWKGENVGFDIVYLKKENGGKPRAINFGVQHAKGVFFLMVDSDDCLVSDAIWKFTLWVQEIQNDDRFIGVGAARAFPNRQYIKGHAPDVNELGYVDASNLERKKYNLDADMVEAYKLDILKKYPMAEWPGEKFAPEQIALNEIALAGYILRWHKDIVYICDYLADGLTKNSQMLEKDNPMGYAMMYNHMFKYENTAKRNFFIACQFIALSLYGKHVEYLFKTNNWFYTIIALPFGVLLSVRRKWQFMRISEAE